MKARREYYLKCLANRVAGYENTRKRFLIDWKHARIEEDRNSPIQDMEFFVNQVTAGHTHPRGQRKPTTIEMHQAISQNMPEPLEPTPPSLIPESINTDNDIIKNKGLFSV
jgi:hypothetical protein